MNGENVKKIYMINLDKTRLILLGGLFVLFCSISFITGFKWSASRSVVSIPSYPVMPSTEEDQEHILKTTEVGRDNQTLILPEEDNRIFNRRDNDKNGDPFLSEPSEIPFTKHQTASSAKKSLHINQKQTTMETIPADEGKAYTIQVAAFVHEKDAIAYKNLLKKKEIDARVDQGKTHYYVRAGRSLDKKSLQPLLRKINRTMKLEAIVVQRKLPAK